MKPILVLRRYQRRCQLVVFHQQPRTFNSHYYGDASIKVWRCEQRTMCYALYLYFVNKWHMQFKHKIMILAVFPLMAAAIVIGLIVNIQAHRLANDQASIIRERMLSYHKEELKHYTNLALTSIDHLYASNRNDLEAQKEARAILSNMNYGINGYFFVYDLAGNCLVHSRQPELVGHNYWALRDPDGLLVIQGLIKATQQGDGFLSYKWHKPSDTTIKDIPKISHVILLKRWGWIVGTGIYLDDVAQTTHTLHDDIARNNHSTLWGLGLVAMLAAIVLFSGGIILTLNERRLADKELKDLAQCNIVLQEEERAQVSRNLHDVVIQSLVSIGYQLELIKYQLQNNVQEALLSLNKGLASLNEVMTQVRHISHDLRPTLLDSLGLRATLEQFGQEFSQHTGLHTLIRSEILAGILSKTEEIMLFRITQDALRNVERHARQATSVEVHLYHAKESVRLSIMDDGCGFNVENIDRWTQGIGLRNMRERIEYHNGKLELFSIPGRTEVVAILPLQI